MCRRFRWRATMAQLTARRLCCTMHRGRSLEERCCNLHQKATRDPLTQLANRAEFDRVHALFVGVHLERNLPCSLIITDIDRFKMVNDNYGPPSRRRCNQELREATQGKLSRRRSGGAVWRRGVCDSLRKLQQRYGGGGPKSCGGHLHNCRKTALAGACVTASFGVTELQPGDWRKAMLHRADGGYTLSERHGRNKVVQLGSGIGEASAEPRKNWWWPWQSKPASLSTEATLVTAVPLPVAVGKVSRLYRRPLRRHSPYR